MIFSMIKTMRTLHPLAKDALITGVLALIALSTSVAAGWIVLNPDHKTATGDVDTTLDSVETVRSRTIVDFSLIGTGDTAIVRYTYVGAVLPAKLVENEI